MPTALDRDRDRRDRSRARRPCPSFATWSTATVLAAAMACCARAQAAAHLDPSLRCVSDDSWIGTRARAGRVTSMSCSGLLSLVFACVNRSRCS